MTIEDMTLRFLYEHPEYWGVCDEVEESVRMVWPPGLRDIPDDVDKPLAFGPTVLTASDDGDITKSPVSLWLREHGANIEYITTDEYKRRTAGKGDE